MSAPGMTDMSDSLRGLPSVDRLLAHPRLGDGSPPALRTAAVRQTIDAERQHLRSGAAATPFDALAEQAAAILEAMTRPSLQRVINATGVILHTNLGRAPLSDDALAAMFEVGTGYTNLEFELESGGRGTRFKHLEGVLQRVTGAEAGIAVNNNASAMLLLLSALCAGREVVISRSQAVEIGGGFRIPDVLRQSGATLVEVGTTNRTSVRDFADAVNERTAALLRVHASNFRIVGFTSFPALTVLSDLAHERGILMLDDLGSGCLLDTRLFGMLPEPTVQQSVAAGVDVVSFSGDKLIGGPQAGILVGRATSIDQLRRHPLARAVRMDKTGIAALAATLRHFERGEATTRVPVWTMIAAPLEEIDRRARIWAAAASLAAEVVPARTMIGGGSLPEEGVPTRALAISVASPDQAAAWLRRYRPPIVARIEAGRLLLDPRTVQPAEDRTVAVALSEMAPA